ncbi:MAG: TIGR03790 family protein [Burkholderiaceae bacterium]
MVRLLPMPLRCFLMCLLAVLLPCAGVAAQAERITARELGLVINTADPYSVAVGAYYESRRGIPARQVLRVELPVRPSLSAAEFASLALQVRAFMGPQVQGLALAWTQPFAVECNSITAAITLGLQGDLCSHTCAASNTSALFSSSTARPFRDYALRPSMLLASRDVEAAKALIERGIASDHSLVRPGEQAALAVFVKTHDPARNVRAAVFPPPGPIAGTNAQVTVRDVEDRAPLQRVFLYQTGLARVDAIDHAQWLPGALADHLTSSGGQLLGAGGQTSVLDWLEAGATASYGTVSEPCNHLQKFPQPQVLLSSYLQGVSALEAYWRSVAWPAQGVFVGEPLAAPFAPADIVPAIQGADR